MPAVMYLYWDADCISMRTYIAYIRSTAFASWRLLRFFCLLRLVVNVCGVLLLVYLLCIWAYVVWI